MPDHEFEKKVQDKMAELRLRPSAPVWERVEQELNKKDKRRRGLLWLPFLLAAIGGMYFLAQSNLFHQDKIAASDNTIPVTPQSRENKKITSPGVTLPKENGIIKGAGSVVDTVLSTDDHLTKTAGAATQRQIESNRPPESGRLAIVHDAADIQKRERNILLQKLQENERTTEPAVVTTTFNHAPPSTLEVLESKSPVSSALKTGPASLQHIDVFKNMYHPSGRDLTVHKTFPPKRKFEFGLVFTSGRSHINNGKISSLLTNGAVPSNRLYSSFASPTANPPGPIATYVPPSELKPGIAFNVGGFVKKQVSRNFSVAIGLQYKFYTTSNKLGTWRDTIISSNAASNMRLETLTKVYHTGSVNKYVNQFHFIELPVSMEGRLINGKFPLEWNAGLSYARLIASNALHYDSDFRLYYKNNKLLKKNQVNINAGLSTTLFRSTQNPIQLGPEFSYGLSDIVKLKTTEAKHFLFLGLKAVVPINK